MEYVKKISLASKLDESMTTDIRFYTGEVKIINQISRICAKLSISKAT